MAGTSGPSIRRCYGCLASSNDRELHTYYVKKSNLKSMLQLDQWILCYLCKRVAIQTEKFIHNVEASKALFDSKNDINISNDNYKPIPVPLMNLTCWTSSATDIIHLNSNESDELVLNIKNEFEQFVVEFAPAVEIEIKNEEHYQEAYDYQSEAVNIHEEQDSTICIKQAKNIIEDDDDDDDEYMIADLKYPLTREKCQKKLQKKYCAAVINLSKEELQQERAQKAAAKRYLDATFKCEDCIKGFVMRTPYENHMKLHSKERGEFECDICKQRLETTFQMEQHYRYHVERYKCSKCEETRNCFTSLKDHYLRKHNQGKFEYSCPICFKQFRFRSSFQKHKADKHENRERIGCKYCDKTFASVSAMNYHLKFNHTEEESVKLKSHTCKDCGRSFKMLQKLKNHMITHSTQRNHYCVECDKSFKTRTALNLHFKTVVAHNKNKPQEYIHSCPHCDKRFPLKKGLSRHISNIHIPKIHLQCSQCGQTFKSKRRLTTHIFSHDGIERVKKHSCTVCNKRFYDKDVLSKHMNTHTGAKPFQCTQCPAQFAHSGSLYNHVKLVHLNLTRKGTPKGTITRKQRN